MDLKASWEDHLPLVEFSYNNSYQASMVEIVGLLYVGQKLERSLLGSKIVQIIREKIKLIKERLKTARKR